MLNQLKDKYRELRFSFSQSTGCDSSDFNTAVTSVLPPEPTPEQWIKAAKRVTIRCGKCSGTGHHVGSRFGGVCFRCRGKGNQNYKDVKRNVYYDTKKIIQF